MNRLLFLSVLLIFFIVGCNSEEQDFSGKPTIEGYIVNVEDKYILVVHGITKEQATTMSWNELSKENEKRYEPHAFNAGFFDSFSEFEKGQRVKVWGKYGEQESYPPQSELGKIKLVEETG